MKIQTRIYSRTATRIYLKCNSLLMSYKLKISKFSWKDPQSRDPLLPSMAHFPTMGRFCNDLKGVVMKNFPGDTPPNPCFRLLSSHLVSAPPPKYQLRSGGPEMIQNCIYIRGAFHSQKSCTPWQKSLSFQKFYRKSVKVFLF